MNGKLKTVLSKILGKQRFNRIRWKKRFAVAKRQIRDQKISINADAKLLFYIGTGRSGHSFHGALLDSFPDIAIADELDVFKYYFNGFSHQELDKLCLLTSNRQAINGKKKLSSLNYNLTGHKIDGAFHGNNNPETVKILGFSKAALTNSHFSDHTEESLNFLKELNREYKAVFYLRNPLDVIATTSIRRSMTVKSQVMATIKYLNKLIFASELIPKENQIWIFHEDLILKRDQSIRSLLEELEYPIDKGQILAVANNIASELSITRNKVNWDPKDLQLLLNFCNENIFLHRYVDDILDLRTQFTEKSK